MPKFNVPRETSPPALAAGAYATWVMENWQRLRDAGEFEELLDDPGRVPVDVRFRLDRQSPRDGS